MKRIVRCTMGNQGDTSHYEGALLEDINSKFEAILEGQAALIPVPGQLTRLEDRLTSVEDELQAIKMAVRDEFGHLKQRITKLERVSAS